MSNPVLAFLESSGQVDAALTLFPRPDVLIPLAPAAAARIEQLGLAYRKAEDFYDEKGLVALGDTVIDAEADWARWVDGWLQERVPEFRQTGFQPAMAHFLYLKVMFDSLRIRAHILQAISKSLRPDRVVYFGPEIFPMPQWDLLFRESLNARCLPCWAETNGISLQRLPLAGDERFNRVLDSRWKPTSIFRKLVKTKNSLMERFRADETVDGGSLRNILLRPEYDVAHLRVSLTRRGFQPVLWSGFMKSISGKNGKVRDYPSISEISTDPHWMKLANIEGLGLGSVIQARLALWWNLIIPVSWETFQSARERLRQERIAAVLIPTASTVQDAAVLQAAKREGIPVFIYQHGGFGGNCEYEAWEYVDLLQSDTMFFYGEGSASYYRQRLLRYADRRAMPVAIGSARLDAMARASGKVHSLRRRLGVGDLKVPLVLYFPAMHAAYIRYLCGGEMPDVSHWELQRDIVRVFKKFPRVRLVYRPFEGFFESPLPMLLAQELPNARIEREFSLVELAWAADAVITDIPSTGLLEVLLTNRPVLAYADSRSIRMAPEAKGLLRKRASLDEMPAEFIRRIETFLYAGDFNPLQSPDRSFLRAYGTGVDDGHSAERAATLLAELPVLGGARTDNRSLISG